MNHGTITANPGDQSAVIRCRTLKGIAFTASTRIAAPSVAAHSRHATAVMRQYPAKRVRRGAAKQRNKHPAHPTAEQSR
jgi:hypothetical protein